jgi:hypothetical protein
MRVITFRQCGSLIVPALFLFTLGLFTVTGASAQQTDINGPAGSGKFGYHVIALPNGNIVITDPYYDIPGGAADVGAVYLYHGSTGAMISMLTGSTANDGFDLVRVSIKVVTLKNGNFVITNPNWDNGSIVDAGAVTFVNGTTGLSGTISASNSLVGSAAYDYVGFIASTATPGNYYDYVNGVTALANGNYVVVSSRWDNHNTADAGAVTFGNGMNGVTGEISSSNSLVGSTYGGAGTGVTGLPNGNYVVRTPSWSNGAEYAAGAVTFGNGTSGVRGTISPSNSLVGSTAGDRVGFGGVTVLTNANYVISSPLWGNDSQFGAVTLGNGVSGVTGTVSASNSLVGSTFRDQVGSWLIALANGNYVVGTPDWDNGIQDVGAVTFGNGENGVVGVVSASNSLIGSSMLERVGSYGVTALTNGNYVVISPEWGAYRTNLGAVTLGNGASGTTGTISALNSLVGTTRDDRVGIGGVTDLTNGNFVVSSPAWDNGAMRDVGAVTFVNGMRGFSGAIAVSNSLVGSTSEDGVGAITVLPNGNYLVGSIAWDNGAIVQAGAVTFGSGTSGVTGTVSTSNSLVGSTNNDFVGGGGYIYIFGMPGMPISTKGITALSNGNYVVSSSSWGNLLGAVTLGSGASGITGTISPSNSLVGSATTERVGNGGVTALPNGDYVVLSTESDNGAIINAGAVSYLSGTSIGEGNTITPSNSVLGGMANAGYSMNFSFDVINNQLVVGRPFENIVTLFSRFAPVSVSGKVMTANGAGVRNAIVSLTDAGGITRTAKTGSFGYYRFDDVLTGQTCGIVVTSKGYTFTPRTISISSELTDVDFVAE